MLLQLLLLKHISIQLLLLLLLQITVPNIADVISSLGATLTKWPKLP